MAIKELKEKLHVIINTTNNEILLVDLLNEAEGRLHSTSPHVLEGLSEEDYNDLAALVQEDPEKDTITFDQLKSSLGRWFIQ